MKQILKADKREITGRKVKSLRKGGIIPANVYGKNLKSLSVQVTEKDFIETFKETGETGLIELTVGKEVHPVLVHGTQIHPVTDKILHVDFFEVNLKEKVTANIPVELIGESEAVKSGLGTAVQQLQEIEVEALPTDFPEKFEVDITSLKEVDQAIFVKDLKVDKAKVEIKSDLEQIVVKIEPQQKEEVIVAPVTEEAPAEGEAPKETTEGETPKEEAGSEA